MSRDDFRNVTRDIYFGDVTPDFKSDAQAPPHKIIPHCDRELTKPKYTDRNADFEHQ